MKYLFTLVICLLMTFQIRSQAISTQSPRVQIVINSKGDTLVQFKLSDAKIILGDLMDKREADSLVVVYMERDSLNASTINLQVSEIKLLQEKSINQEELYSNLQKLLANKDTEIKDLNDVIKQQKKEIRKQKILKIIGFVAAVTLPITTILLLSH